MPEPVFRLFSYQLLIFDMFSMVKAVTEVVKTR